MFLGAKMMRALLQLKGGGANNWQRLGCSPANRNKGGEGV